MYLFVDSFTNVKRCEVLSLIAISDGDLYCNPTTSLSSLLEAGTAYRSRPTEFTPGFLVGSVLLIFLPVSLDCPFLIAPLVFSNVYIDERKHPWSFEIWIFRNGQPDCDDNSRTFVAMSSVTILECIVSGSSRFFYFQSLLYLVNIMRCYIQLWRFRFQLPW
jgi:hypothetical protein